MIWADKLALVWFVLIFLFMAILTAGRSADLVEFFDIWLRITGFFVVLPWIGLRVIDAVIFMGRRGY